MSRSEIEETVSSLLNERTTDWSVLLSEPLDQFGVNERIGLLNQVFKSVNHKYLDPRQTGSVGTNEIYWYRLFTDSGASMDVHARFVKPSRPGGIGVDMTATIDGRTLTNRLAFDEGSLPPIVADGIGERIYYWMSTN